jgi:hypothetical protein
MSTPASPPFQASVIETDENSATRRDPFFMAKGWQQWFIDLLARVGSALQLLAVVTLPAPSGASIPATGIPLGNPSAGLYQVSWYARITTAAGVSSSLTVSIGWVEHGVALGFSGPALTGNTVTSVQTGTVLVQIDANSAITYSTIYASNPAGVMRYALTVSVTRVS